MSAGKSACATGLSKLVCLAALLVLAAPGFQKSADLILHNGKVWTVDHQRPQAQAIATSGSKIVRVGTNSEVLALKGAATRIIDLQGKTVLPGFNDAHTHFENATQWFFEVRLIDVDNQAELLKRLREAVQRVPKGMWITATDWSALAAWDAEKKKLPFHSIQPDLASVDAVSPDHPVLFRRYDRSYFANSVALKRARITDNTPDPRGGRYEKHPVTGHLTGMLIGRAGEQMEQTLPPVSMAQKLIGARGVMKELNRYGVTSIHDIARLDAISQTRVFPTSIERSYSDVNIFRELKSRGDLSVRVYAFMPLAVWSDLAKNGIRPGLGDEAIRYGILKDFADGSLMFEPFANNPKFSGGRTFRFVDEEAEQRDIIAADRAGFDLGIHVIGDKALHILLNWYETAIAKNGPRDRRFRIIHVEYAKEEDLKRAGRMHLIADVTPYHLLGEPDSVEKSIGPERAKMAFAWRTMIDNGVKLDIVSDLPGLYNKQDVGPFNPLENMYYAVTRTNLSGYPSNGWHPEQCLTIQEAIEAYTLNPAFASREENLKGSITEGKLADLVVLSKDILSIKPAELLSTRVVYTILGGKIVWQKP